MRPATTATWLALALALVAPAACSSGGDADSDGEGTKATGDEGAAAIDAAPLEPEKPARRTERAVFRLGDNRLLAHAHRGGALYIDAGSGGFGKYARFGTPELLWNLRRRVDGIAVAEPHRYTSFDVPLTASQAATATALHMRVYARSGRKLSILLNGRSIGAGATLQEGWHTVSVPLPEGKLARGENRFNFEFGTGKQASIAWFQLGGETAETAPVSYDAATDTFTIGSGNGLAYYVLVPEDGNLVGTVSDGCTIAVRAATHASHADAVMEGEDAAVDLSAFANEVVRLELTAAGCDAAALSDARLTIPGTLGETHTAPPPKHVLLWVMDALRADRVKPFNPEARAKVPNFERLAATSTIFTNFWVEGNESQTSHSSLWSSLYPAVHNVRTTGKKGGTWQLKSKFDRIPQQTKKLDFYNIGVTANGYVNVDSGYGKDFDEFTNAMREKMYYDNGTVPSDKLQQFAIAAAEEHFDKSRVLLYLGTIDTHAPWMARSPWIEEYSPNYRGVHDTWIDLKELGWRPGTMHCSAKPTNERDFDRLMEIYDSDVSFQDHSLGMMLDDLERLGIADETMIILTADHGEEMFEHARCGHGASLYETLVHVPLLIHYPPLFPEGKVVVDGVDGVDVLPTLVEALGLPVIEAAQGKSLLGLAQAGIDSGYVRPTYASQYEYAHAMRMGDWKMHIGKNGVDLHNLASDPFEYEDLSYERPLEHRFLTDAFSMFMINRVEWKRRLWGVASNMTAQAARDLDAALD